jgi:hypothetical protein
MPVAQRPARGGQQPVVVLDWQSVGFGRGTIDAAFWLGTRMTVDKRRAHVREPVAH